MFSRANKVPNEINKRITKRIIKQKQPYWNTIKTELMFNNLISSQDVQKVLTYKMTMRMPTVLKSLIM